MKREKQRKHYSALLYTEKELEKVDSYIAAQYGKFKTNTIPDAVALTLKERQSASVQNDVLLISESDEYYYALDMGRKTKEGNCPVIALLPTLKSSDCEVVCNSFGEFLCMRFGIL